MSTVFTNLIESLPLTYFRLFQQLTSKEGDFNGELKAIYMPLDGIAMVVQPM